ncbi:LysR family transcriptional regulator [Neobacillus niacini]|uniref:LysR family transcriptional regulator n=1 Tax=Neobacillus niacini TaxID=86668 RepID=UPI0021CB947E|nr:LysR family transcriptional regulator [Neobacillus niacini]MCM3763644.1 LysR family transcriptional regulator [Neobacillus niacini]
MNLDSLKMFCLVVDEGSISKAARLSYVSQPAVTRQIRQLEEMYGALLFERTDGKLKLTKAGEILYPYAQEIVEYLKRSVEAVQEVTGCEESILNVGASLTIGEYMLPAILSGFTRSFPKIKFNILIGNTPAMIAKLENNEIDIALVESGVENTEFIIEKFAEDELILVTPNNHRLGKRGTINIEELSEEKMIWRESDSGTRLIVENALKEYGILEHIESTMELGSMQSIKSAVEAGLGLSILPRLAVSRELTYGTLQEIKIANFYLSRDLWMVQKNHRFKKTGLHYFVEFIRKSN